MCEEKEEEVKLTLEQKISGAIILICAVIIIFSCGYTTALLAWR